MAVMLAFQKPEQSFRLPPCFLGILTMLPYLLWLPTYGTLTLVVWKRYHVTPACTFCSNLPKEQPVQSCIAPSFPTVRPPTILWTYLNVGDTSKVQKVVKGSPAVRVGRTERQVFVKHDAEKRGVLWSTGHD